MGLAQGGAGARARAEARARAGVRARAGRHPQPVVRQLELGQAARPAARRERAHDAHGGGLGHAALREVERREGVVPLQQLGEQHGVALMHALLREAERRAAARPLRHRQRRAREVEQLQPAARARRVGELLGRRLVRVSVR